jgi:O-antigen/teichoic acid export membrane protein
VTAPPAPASEAASEAAFVRRLGWNTIAQVVGLIGSTILGFATFLVVTRALGPAAFGDLATSQVYLLVPVALADVGLATGVLREISVSPERSEHAIRASLPLRALLSAAAVGLAALLAFVLPLEHRARLAIWLGAIGAYFTLLNLGLLPILQARLRMHVATVANLAGRVLTLVLVIAAVALDRGFTAIVLAYIAGFVATFVVDAVAVSRLVSLRPIVDLAYWRSLLQGSAAIGLATGLFLSYYRLDTVLVALVRGSREVGLYGAAFKFVELAEVFVSTIGVSLFPSFTRLIASGDVRIRRAMQRSFDLVAAVGAPLVVVIMLMPRQILELTAGPEFTSASSVLRLLAPYLALLFLNGVLVRILAAAHQDRLLLVVAVTVLVLNVALNLALLPVYGYKVAALTSLATEIVIVVTSFTVVRRALGFLPSPRYLVVVGAAVAVMVGVFMALRASPWPAAVAASTAYVAVVALLPGTVRDAVAALLPRRREVAP